MEIYAVRLIFQFIIENDNSKMYEESIRLFHADSSEDAFERANRIAECEEFEYTNVYGNKVHYKFLNSTETFLIHNEIQFKDGDEVFSRIVETENPVNGFFKSCSVEDMYVLRNNDFLLFKEFENK